MGAGMVHLWLRAETRANEARTGLTPEGAAALIARGFRVSVEESADRCLPLAGYLAAGCQAVPHGGWPDAPDEAIILGLKELPEGEMPLRHRHILFGHAYKGQPAGQRLLRRFRAGGGVLYDLEALVDEAGRRVAAFGHWAGFAGAGVAALAHAAQARGGISGPVARFADSGGMIADVAQALQGLRPPRVLIIGARGRVGRGAAEFCAALGLPVTEWDIEETAHGGPFPEVLAHEIFLNCILAAPGCPVFLPATALGMPRALRVVGDIACDPGAEFSPVRVYDRATDWARPALRVAAGPVLDVVAIDNLPSLLPVESSLDFAAQLLPHLLALESPDAGVWARARQAFERHVRAC